MTPERAPQRTLLDTLRFTRGAYRHALAILDTVGCAWHSEHLFPIPCHSADPRLSAKSPGRQQQHSICHTISFRMDAYTRISALCRISHLRSHRPLVGQRWQMLIPIKRPDADGIEATLHDLGRFHDRLRASQPQDVEYLAMQEELARLHHLPDTCFERIVNKMVHKEEPGAHLLQVCTRLRLTGELPPAFRDTNRLTEPLLVAINRFRHNNAIPESDSLDLETIAKLNRPIAYYEKRLRANMERLRWKMIPAKGDTCIVVNIPDFTLQTRVGDRVVFRTRICCGKTQNPKADPSRIHNGITQAYKAESPMLHGDIGRLVLTPEWHIPYDILNNTTQALPKQHRRHSTRTPLCQRHPHRSKSAPRHHRLDPSEPNQHPLPIASIPRASQCLGTHQI